VPLGSGVSWGPDDAGAWGIQAVTREIRISMAESTATLDRLPSVRLLGASRLQVVGVVNGIHLLTVKSYTQWDD
jgi:hypothetical protein